jgi:predicted DCC family thiol-disulfide oxidoreductase YuxK
MEDRGASWRFERQQRWAVLYDADCDFCTWVLSWLLVWDRARRLEPIALQSAEASHLLADLSSAERMASVHLIAPAGTRRSGGAAFVQLLRLVPGGRIPAAGFASFPKLTEKAYRLVAEHRSALSKLIPMAAKCKARRYVQEYGHEAR